MWTVTAEGHWKGDPTVACERLTATVKGLSAAKRLAVLLRVLADPDLRERLLDQAEQIEADALDPLAAPMAGGR